MEQLQFKIQGLDCAEEVAILKKALAPIMDEDRLQFDVLNGKLTVAAGEGTAAELTAAIAKTGMKAVPWETFTAIAPGEAPFWECHGRDVFIVSSAAAVLAGFLWHVSQAGLYAAFAAGEGEGAGYPLPTALLYFAGMATGLSLFAPKAFHALRSLRPDMNLLMFIAVAGALGLGNYFEAALVALLFSVALLLETWSVGRARRAIAALMDLTPPTARYRCCGDSCVMEMPVGEVPLGVTAFVRPGERFPLDGILRKGETTVNQAPITGESMPVAKAPGDEVYAGTINQDGAVEFEVTKAAGDTMLARCIALVEGARAKRSPSERWVDQFARYYTPIMMALAVATAVLPPILSDMAWRESVYNALVLLLIACPCALVISTPVSIVAGLASAARAGVLIKGGVYLEAPARLRAIAFDKTGTLTLGQPTVQEVVPLNGHGALELLGMAASIEALSQHPLARAIVRKADADGVHYEPAGAYTAVQGKGAEAFIREHRYWIGSHRLLREKGIENDAATNRAIALEDAGHSVVLLGSEVTKGNGPAHVCGLVSIADQVRPDAAGMVKALKAAGMAHVVMLTGDNEGTARAVAEAAGVDDFQAELLPADKAAALGKLAERYGHVAMVGDGVNDAPAMAAAGLGIAMGAAGSDAAIETADIALMSDDLSRIPWLIAHSRRVLRVIKQNIALALGLKVLVLALALAGWATLWLAILADMGASLLVIFNGLRLLRGKAA